MLHMTKVALGMGSLDDLERRMAHLGEGGSPYITTKYRPTRHEEMSGVGSLFWIVKHQLVARSPILGFGEAEGGRVAIHLGRDLVRVAVRPKRAHQGWRYLSAEDAPADLADGGDGFDRMPPELMGRLAGLGLV
jgi:hypothetical protein